MSADGTGTLDNVQHAEFVNPANFGKVNCIPETIGTGADRAFTHPALSFESDDFVSNHKIKYLPAQETYLSEQDAWKEVEKQSLKRDAVALQAARNEDEKQSLKRNAEYMHKWNLLKEREEAMKNLDVPLNKPKAPPPTAAEAGFAVPPIQFGQVGRPKLHPPTKLQSDTKVHVGTHAPIEHSNQVPVQRYNAMSVMQGPYQTSMIDEVFGPSPQTGSHIHERETNSGHTMLTQSAKAGDVVLQIYGLYGFEIGNAIIIEAGTPRQEVNRIVGFGSLILGSTLKFDHGPGATVGNIPMPQFNLFVQQEATRAGLLTPQHVPVWLQNG